MSSNKFKVRFAPSPTGYLHLGNARMATLNYFLAKKITADYILRIDDTDIGRVKQEYIDGTHEDLTWLGISWDSEFKQSDRLDVYNEFLERLKKDNLVYPCYETPQELEYKKKLQIAMKKPPIYDRSALKLTAEEVKKYESEGRKPYYRLKISYTDIAWKDLIKGEINFKGEHISDPVVMRDDGSFLYLLTSVIDDISAGITHIIRGEDHVVNTAIQIQMFQYLGAEVPTFAHLPLITNNSGEGFSKRDGALSLRNLRNDGIHPMAINNYLFMLGLGERDKVYSNIAEIVEDFDLEKYNSASAKFDEDKLLKINLQILQTRCFAEMEAMIKRLLNLDINEDFWNGIKHNIVDFKDITNWYNIIYSNDLKTTCENKDLIKIALDTMPQEDFTENTWSAWLDSIKLKSNLKGKELFHPLRLAFSGVANGPDFKSLISLIGKERLTNRLKNLV
ncbi:MAG: glutamate--tRNA ligase [Alphaproteobacteria bacterium]|jgi:glutamyl-tRNA synthetase|nr:glutamate--tRNA ligase [Alphaproteobacteria bacterium]